MEMRLLLSVMIMHSMFIEIAEAGTPNRAEAATKAEQAAYDKAKCVYDAVTVAGRVFFPDGEAPDQREVKGKDVLVQMPAPSTPEQATAKLDAFAKRTREGVRACLTEGEVYDLGRYSYLEDKAMLPGNGCAVTKAPAAHFGRTPNNSGGDIVEGSVHWMTITDTASIAAHPFFQGKAEAQALFSKGGACETIVKEFGPEGSRFPGLVRPGL